MTDPVISPDGKLVWNGDEWVPIKSDSNETLVSIHDSVVAGDLNVTHNDTDDIKQAVVQALEEVRLSEQLSKTESTESGEKTESTESGEKDAEKVLQMSEKLALLGIEIDPWDEYNDGEIAWGNEKTDIAKQHFLNALDIFKKIDHYEGEAHALSVLGCFAEDEGNLHEAERLYTESLRIVERDWTTMSYSATTSATTARKLDIGFIALKLNQFDRAEKILFEGLFSTERWDFYQNKTLMALGEILIHRGVNLDQSERYIRKCMARRLNLDSLSKAIDVWSEAGVPIYQRYLDKNFD